MYVMYVSLFNLFYICKSYFKNLRYQRNYKSKTCNDGSGQSGLRRKLINKKKKNL